MNTLDQPATTPESTGDQLDSPVRRSIYWLLIICSLAVVSARLWQVESISYGVKTPFLSANDRSRWCTIRALGDHDTYAIDLVLQDEGGQQWDTIDKVMHWGRDFQPHFYSSKPPLLPTILTYPYLAIKELTGWTLRDDTFKVVRIMLLVCQVLPLALFFWALGRIADQVARTEWARMFIMVSAAFGTFVTTFAITLNNHVPAVISVALATCAIVQIHRGISSSWFWYFLAGITSAFAAANELPAACFLLVCFTLCLFHSVARTLLAFLPAVALIAFGFFATNQRGHNDWKPPYAHRSDGPVLDIITDNVIGRFQEVSSDDEFDQLVTSLGRDPKTFEREELRILESHWPAEDNLSNRWIVYFGPKQLPIVVAERADGIGFEIRRWENWYEYPGSYWLADNESKSEVDKGEQSVPEYLFNLTFGHHGAFSLTPIWLLSVLGILPLCCNRKYGLRMLALGILAISIVVIAFYVTRPLEDRNYGGVTCGPRWLFWLGPLWFVAMIPALDWVAKKSWRRILASLLLVVSIASSFYAWTNPWKHPWIYEAWFYW